LPALRHSSNPCETAKKKDGTNSTARQVDAMIPLNTLSPSEIRLFAAAPVASISGTTPSPKANDVINISRNRERDASTTASRIGLPWTTAPVAAKAMTMRANA
jgi:hypothetical protein